ncbi:MAG: hypothetical protein Q9208_006704 [Pyrenodesmia sp. 3 TL-2023]
MDPSSTLSLEERIERLEVGAKEIRKEIDELKAERKREMDWMITCMMHRDRRKIDPLTADLFLAFAEKAMALLSRTHPSLVPEAIKDDRCRIPILADVVAAIPEEIYERSPQGQGTKKVDVQIASVEPPPYFPYDKFEFAALMMQSYWAQTEDKKVLDPLFMFVYGMSFEEMGALKPWGKWGRRSCVSMDRRPWSERDAQQTWREPVKRGRRCGGRNGRRGG